MSQALEVLLSLESRPQDWTALSLPQTSNTFKNNQQSLHTEEKSDGVWVVLQRYDNKAFIFSHKNGNYTPLPALFFLESCVYVAEYINDYPVLQRLTRFIGTTGLLHGNLFEFI
jgi:hypothetical protein